MSEKQTGSVAIFTRASHMLAEANTIQEAKELKDLAITAAEWAKRRNMGKEAIQHASKYALLAERKMGDLLKAEVKAGRLATRGKNPGTGTLRGVPGGYTSIPTTADIGLTRKERSEAARLSDLPVSLFAKVLDGTRTVSSAITENVRKKHKTVLNAIAKKTPKSVRGKYDVIVIDPPWPMKKIEREVRPNQAEMDYPIMTEDELAGIQIPAAPNAHVWLWSTHKFMPLAFELLATWGMKYTCTFVWHKPGGFQPHGLPQYNCEFALYARKGSPVFVDTKNFNVCFNGMRGKHSEKPEEFYEMIRRVTAGRRLDMFGRREIDGFDAWGNEAQ